MLAYRLVHWLHFRGVHLLCRPVRESVPIRDVAYRRDDGTIYKPDLNGFMTRVRNHAPRWQR